MGECNKSMGHPCFDMASRSSVGRIHLAVAPRCNIKCNYCTRKYDCANESRPGVASRVITPIEALRLVREAVAAEPRIQVVGIAGPGDPLSNQATFETLQMVRQNFPDLSLCLSTNGLLLSDKIDLLTEAGLDSLTVTVNTLNESSGARIYDYVSYGGEVLRGIEAAALLRDKQLAGIRQAVERGIRVKVNSVLLPGINEHEMPFLARLLGDMGVSVMNIMPLIPQAKFADLTPVSMVLHHKIRTECAEYIRQIHHCQQCRADAVGLLGNKETLFAC
ncbi:MULTISPECIES: radical SAM protein [Dehalococcoides]|uniref:FeMo cofactor biosynthesis protein NifB n=1 Tax=Dehalococcoides mccartyi TaxID=61435 RepID=A0AB38Z8E9_9CHLR|nr:radical SAM protein [Dehalococcoides mccartyi]MDN4186726.1 radical SAM protein [Dehalococcoides mccartyi]OBW61665.1 MAG: nitrogenase molybdenum-iron cofactor biosynthesis protein [Dehalococcoides mccartyi]WRO06827.1 radical SAM protein [Dehalococcoides mccartyi]